MLRDTDIGVPCEGFRTRKIVVVSTFLDGGEKSKQELAELYRKRWRVELFIDDIKTTLGMNVLRTKSPGMVCREILVHMIAYNLVRCLVARSGGHPERTSFKGACDRANVWAPVLLVMAPGKRRDAVVDELLDAVASGRVAERPGRCEPRVKRRRPKTYQLLKKPRHEMVEQMHRGKRLKKA